VREENFRNKTARVRAVKLKEDSFDAKGLGSTFAPPTTALLALTVELKCDDDCVPE